TDFCTFVCFFFSSRRRHTRFSRDWSSDVCSSDLARMGWRVADKMWRLAGDTATDYNHYTKRVMLSAVYGSTMGVFLDDDSEDYAETKAFLDRRIENIMQFEKTKAKLLRPGGDRFSMARFLGRLRYRGNSL